MITTHYKNPKLTELNGKYFITYDKVIVYNQQTIKGTMTKQFDEKQDALDYKKFIKETN